MAPKKAATPATTTITKGAVAQTKTVLSQQQCLEMVQIMIHGSLSEIFYMRQVAPEVSDNSGADYCSKFFPDYAYGKQQYQVREQPHSYNDFVADRIANDPEAASSETVPLNVLRRNHSGRVDKFLSWLENGVFPELEARNLNSLQVSVHPYQDRDKVLETYNLTISYSTEKPDGIRAISGLAFESPNDHRLTFGSTSASMVFLFRHLIMLGHGLPHLEGDGQDTKVETCISMTLFYENGKSSSNHPVGFVGRADRPMSVVSAEGWETRAEMIPNLQFGPQTAALQIAYLQRKDIGFYKGNIEKIDLAIPTSIEFVKKMGSFEPIVKTRTWEAVLKNGNPTDVKSNVECSQPLSTSNAGPESPEKLRSDDTEGLPPTQLSQGPESVMPGCEELLQPGQSELNDSLNTQSSNIPVIRSTVRAMVRLDYMTQGDTQVPNVGQTPQSTSIYSASNDAGEDGPPNQDLVHCQCGDDKTDDDMIKCPSCSTLQHVHCYGYRHAEDDRLSADYTCYRCLFGQKEEGEKLIRLRRLVFKRRGMYRAEKYGLTTMRAFESEIRPGRKPAISTAGAREVYRYLKDECFVVHSGHSKKTAHFEAVTSGPSYDKMLKELCDPLVEISHECPLPSTYEKTKPALGDKMLGSTSSTMQPPMTPSSRFLPARNTSSRTNLDRPRTAQPDKTPSRPPSFRASATKRGSEEDTTDDRTRKRRCLGGDENPSNSQSQFFLATSALASSPAHGPNPAGIPR